MTLHAGLDARFASARYDGVGRYVVALVEELARLDGGPVLHLVRPPHDDAPRHPLPGDTDRVVSIAPRRARRAESPWTLWEMPRLARAAGVDVWHTPFPMAPPFLRVPAVVTLHDCIPERFPSYFGTAHRIAYRAAARSAVRAARVVVVPSQLSADDAQRYHRVAASRLRVVPEGVEPAPPEDAAAEAELRQGLGLPERGSYVLTVGRPRPHKGYATVVRALGRLDPARRPPLVRVGRTDPRLPDGSAELAAQLGVRLLTLQGISDAELLATYRGAGVVAIPSLVEGFGLPLLEALAAGAPVLAGDIQPLRATGGEAARFVRAGDAAWAEALEAALDDRGLGERARREGPAQAARFPWSRCAELTLAAYREAAGR